MLSGPVRNFVCGRAVEHYAAMALMNRSPNITANWAFAVVHSRGDIFHSFSDLFKIRKSSLVAASSLGKCPLALTARRSFPCLERRAVVAAWSLAHIVSCHAAPLAAVRQKIHSSHCPILPGHLSGTVSASVMLKKLAGYSRQNSLSRALREIGRVEPSLFMLHWLDDRESAVVGDGSGKGQVCQQPYRACVDT